MRGLPLKILIFLFLIDFEPPLAGIIARLLIAYPLDFFIRSRTESSAFIFLVIHVEHYSLTL